MAIERVKPIPRHTARINLSQMVLEQEIGNTSELVDYFIARFMLVPPGDDSRQMLVSFINDELGTNDILDAQSYMEDSLRLLLHLVLSQPEYQLG